MVEPDFVACYLVAVDSEPQYLLLKRSLTTYLPGIWQIVTGKLNGGESAAQAVVREVQEETGLVCSKIYNVDVTMFYEQNRKSVAFSANFCGVIERDRSVRISLREHTEFRWCSFEEASQLLAFPAQRETLRFIHENFVILEPELVNVVDEKA